MILSREKSLKILIMIGDGFEDLELMHSFYRIQLATFLSRRKRAS
jgi:hypothetical protein